MKWKHIGIIVIIIFMVMGFKALDDGGWFENPLDKVPSVEFGK